MGLRTENTWLTTEGGVAHLYTNKTGAASVKGEIVVCDTSTDDAVDLAAADDVDNIGVFYESGIADGASVWVVTDGKAHVMLKNATASTRGNWVKVSDVEGRADATGAESPGAILAHSREVAHCLETKGGDTDVLALCQLHQN